jgi:hypothetical protein
MSGAEITRASDAAEALGDPSVGYVVDLDPESDVVMIAFGGLKHSIAGEPPFEFLKALGDTPVKQVFARDVAQVWYQSGVPGLGTDIASTTEGLRDLVGSTGATRLVTMGTSAGGFGAILFGCLLGADAVIAFGPQTFITDELRTRHGDERWPRNIERIHRTIPEADRTLDVADVVAAAPGTPVHVYVGTREPLDPVHADHLAGFPNVHVERFDCGHNVAKHLRDTGVLDQIVDQHILGHPAS